MGQLSAADTFSNATCFSSMGCSSNNWGWSNKLSAAGSATHPMIVGAGKDCKGRSVVGSIDIKCEASGNNALVTLGTVSQSLAPTAPQVGAVTNHFYLGCFQITSCTPPIFWSGMSNKPGACSQNSLQNHCGGSIGAPSVQSATTALLGCSCNSVRYVFHQSSSHFAAARVNGACPTAL